MRKRTALFCSGVLAMSIWLSGNTTYAADMPARAIENVQTLIKNKGNSLENITEEELRLAQTL